MSYHVNTQTMLFDDLNSQEATELYIAVKELIMTGKTMYGNPALVAWCQALGYDSRQHLLVMATAFPQRALLSIIERDKVLPFTEC